MFRAMRENVKDKKEEQELVRNEMKEEKDGEGKQQ